MTAGAFSVLIMIMVKRNPRLAPDLRTQEQGCACGEPA